MRLKLLLAITLVVVSAQSAEAQDTKKPSWRKTEPEWATKNSITLSTSLFSMTAHSSLGGIFPVTLGYDRMINKRFSLGVTAYYYTIFGSFSFDDYQLRESSLFVAGKVNYYLPIFRNVLYLRFGAGLGVGYHYDIEYKYGMGSTYQPDGSEPDKAWRPQIMVDIHWVIRINRNTDILLAPLLVSPSYFIYTPKPIDHPYYYERYYHFNMLGTFGISTRF